MTSDPRGPRSDWRAYRGNTQNAITKASMTVSASFKCLSPPPSVALWPQYPHPSISCSTQHLTPMGTQEKGAGMPHDCMEQGTPRHTRRGRVKPLAAVPVTMPHACIHSELGNGFFLPSNRGTVPLMHNSTRMCMLTVCKPAHLYPPPHTHPHTHTTQPEPQAAVYTSALPTARSQSSCRGCQHRCCSAPGEPPVDTLCSVCICVCVHVRVYIHVNVGARADFNPGTTSPAALDFTRLPIRSLHRNGAACAHTPFGPTRLP
jgi:hypothetical protein